jgi:hypothetical protein
MALGLDVVTDQVGIPFQERDQLRVKCLNIPKVDRLQIHSVTRSCLYGSLRMYSVTLTT